MNPIDFAVIVILFAGFAWGFSRGFIYMGFSLLAIVTGVFGAGKLAPIILPHLFSEKYGQLGYIILFIILFTLIYFIIRKLSHLIEDMIAFLELEWLDSLLGGLLGLFQFLIICGVILSFGYSTGWIKLIPHSEEIKVGAFVTKASQTIIQFIAGNLPKFKV